MRLTNEEDLSSPSKTRQEALNQAQCPSGPFPEMRAVTVQAFRRSDIKYLRKLFRADAPQLPLGTVVPDDTGVSGVQRLHVELPWPVSLDAS
jgi:hypothetical protein